MKINPVLWLELRVRVREKKLWIVSLLYLLCLMGMSTLSLMEGVNQIGVAIEPSSTGLTIFGFAIYTLLGLLVILAPLAGAGAISQEREQRTLPGLLNTTLAPRPIVWGKVMAAWAFVLWLGALSLPFLVLGAIWGGISLERLLLGIGLALAAGLTSAMIAVGLSGFFRRTLTSYLSTGAVFFFWLIVWPILGTLFESLFARDNEAERKTAEHVIFYIFFAHHPVTPLLFSMFDEMGSTDYKPAYVICVALGVWLVLSLFFFLLACRGLRRGLADKG